MQKIKIIKTLPHLSRIFIAENQISAFSHIYSKEVVNFLNSLKTISKTELTFSTLKRLLSSSNFQNVGTIESNGEFTIKGDVITFWLIGYEHPFRAEFFGDDIEKLYTIDEIYNTKLYDQEYILFSDQTIEDITEKNSISFNIPFKVENSSINKFITINSLNNLRGTGVDIEKIEIIETDFTLAPLFYSKFELLEREIESLERLGYEIYIKTKNADSLSKSSKIYSEKQSLKNRSKLFTFGQIQNLDLAAGFISESLRLAIFTDREIFGSIYLTRPEKSRKYSSNIQKLLRQFEGSIEIGDYVVHEDYGIGIYSGLTQEKVDDQFLEYLLVKYDKEDELYVPLNQIEKLTKYIGPEGVEPRITRLGKVSWEQLKSKIKKSTQELAKELISHYAKRGIAKTEPVKIEESKEYTEFVHEFKYRETEDQLRATNEIVADMQKTEPMDRLLVGDVGFGKTEVIMRAAFKIVENGGQVAVLSPTTVLTAQHFEVFTNRFKNFPINIGYVSRFQSVQKNKEIIELVNEGKIDILIGTHRILSSDVKFKNLRLIVVDEEQRFGVKQKEKIKKLNYSAHLLSVSATPIPRTLSMALSSIQSLSIMTTPPVNRKSIKTEVLKDNWDKASQSILSEVARGGQVFFLHNEVQTINTVKEKLEKLAPGVRFTFAHGQMTGPELDRIMTEFYEKKYDCMISTTIIENGLDMPNVNTIIINKAHKFGLSQLYQLRGRVGRSGEQAYCYLLFEGRDLDEDNQKIEKEIDTNKLGSIVRKKTPNYIARLQSLVDNQDLGAGFRIASRDLEIRGAGNLLGEQQSGHISTIGYALYIEILAEEIERLRGK